MRMIFTGSNDMENHFGFEDSSAIFFGRRVTDEVPIVVQNNRLRDDLISYWEMDESSGNRADSHGANDLTDNNTVSSRAGVNINSAADFNASNSEHLSIPNLTSKDFQFRDEKYTVACWVYFDSERTDPVFFKYGSSGNRGYGLIRYSNTVIQWLVSSNGTATGIVSENVAISGWHSVVCTHDSESDVIGISIDGGAFVEVAHTGGTNISTADFYVGRLTSSYFDGGIQKFAVASRVWDEDDAIAFYNAGLGLTYEEMELTPAVTNPLTVATLKNDMISWWELDEEEGNSRVDSHASNDFLEVTSCANKNGINGTKALSIINDSTFDALNLPSGSEADFRFGNNDFSFAVWVSFEKAGSCPAVLKYGGAGAREFSLFKNSADNIDFYISSGGTTVNGIVSSSFPHENGVWNFYYCEYDSVAGQMLIRVNDDTEDTTAFGLGVFAGTTELRLGNWTGSGTTMDGGIQKLSFWDRKLTSEEITNLYNDGYGRTYSEL